MFTETDGRMPTHAPKEPNETPYDARAFAGRSTFDPGRMWFGQQPQLPASYSREFFLFEQCVFANRTDLSSADVRFSAALLGRPPQGSKLICASDRVFVSWMA